MKSKDFLVILGVILFFSPFYFFESVFNFYKEFNAAHGITMGFVKFAILATFGEIVGLRIKTGNYYREGFGLIPRALVWGVLGVSISVAFIIFAKGVPEFLQYAGLENAVASMNEPPTITRFIVSFSISALLNFFFAPVFMIVHKITDTHIESHKGKLTALYSRIDFVNILKNLDWKVQWNFVFMKTIPFFWIPVHSITFMLPQEVRILIAAALGIVLGIILAIAALSDEKSEIK